MLELLNNVAVFLFVPLGDGGMGLEKELSFGWDWWRWGNDSSRHVGAVTVLCDFAHRPPVDSPELASPILSSSPKSDWPKSQRSYLREYLNMLCVYYNLTNSSYPRILVEIRISWFDICLYWYFVILIILYRGNASNFGAKAHSDVELFSCL